VTIIAIIAEEPSTDLHYEFHYNETFKPKFVQNPRIMVPIPLPSELVTSENSATCGANVQFGQEYLIAGRL
jgi:hypothetical protein